MLTKEMYQTWVEFVSQSSVSNRLHPVVYQDYDNWQCRAILARALANWLDRVDIAIQVMESVVAENPEEFNDDQLAWAHMDLAVWKWNAYKDNEKAFMHVETALFLASTLDPSDFVYTSFGEIWFTKLKLLAVSGEAEGAIAEAKAQLLERAGQWEKGSKIIDSAMVYSHLFLADTFSKSDRLTEAEHHFLNALRALGRREAVRAHETTAQKRDISALVDVVLHEIRYEVFDHVTIG